LTPEQLLERKIEAREAGTAPRQLSVCALTAIDHDALAVHTWIVVKEKGAPAYTRYDYTA
jgi:hypothetical protein